MTDLREGLTPEEKVVLGAEGKRPVKVKLCSDQKLEDYFDIAEDYLKVRCQETTDYKSVKLYLNVMGMICDEIADRYYSGYDTSGYPQRYDAAKRLTNEVAAKQSTLYNSNTNMSNTFPALTEFLKKLIGTITNGRLKVVSADKAGYIFNDTYGLTQYNFVVESVMPGSEISEQTFKEFEDRMQLVQKAGAGKINASIQVVCTLYQGKIGMNFYPYI